MGRKIPSFKNVLKKDDANLYHRRTEDFDMLFL